MKNTILTARKNLNTKIDVYTNMLTDTQDIYGDLLFIKTLVKSEVINELKVFFPDVMPEIRNILLFRLQKYIQENLLKGPSFKGYSVVYDIDLEDFAFNLLYEERPIADIVLTMDSLFYNYPDDIREMIDIEIPSIEEDISSLKEMYNENQRNLIDDNITDVSIYAQRMFRPKSFKKKMDKQSDSLLNDIAVLDEYLSELTAKVDAYAQSHRYQTDLDICEKIRILLGLRGNLWG